MFILEYGGKGAKETPSSQMNQIFSNIKNQLKLQRRVQSDITQMKVLQSQVVVFGRANKNFNEFEHPLLNHLQPHHHKITEKNNRNNLRAFWRRKSSNFVKLQRLPRNPPSKTYRSNSDKKSLQKISMESPILYGMRL